MSSGDPSFYDDAPGSLAKLRAILLRFPAVGAALRTRRKINRRWPIPYLAGISADGAVVYIDENIPERLEGIPVDKYLETHESVEWALYLAAEHDKKLQKVLAEKGDHYEPAHHLATAAEQYALISDGYSWEKYRKHLEPLYRPIEHEDFSRAPPDLAEYPYSGKDLARLRAAKKRSKFEKDEVEYVDVAPTEKECEYCAHFLPRLARCETVKGKISAEGVCMKFLPKSTD